MEEELKDIPGFPNYQITKEGKLWSKPRQGTKGGILASHINNNGYLFCGLSKEGIFYSFNISHLVALTWIGPKPEGMWVLHKDDNPLNNHVDNLYYSTRQDNTNDAIRNNRFPCGEGCSFAKLRTKDVLIIKARLANNELPRKIAKDYPVTYQQIVAIKLGSIWKHVPWPEDMLKNLRIVSIFQSVDGEVTYNNSLHFTVFVRLAGCNLRCYANSGQCDTPHALATDSGKLLTLESILNEIKIYLPCKRVSISGGEPTLQLTNLLILVRFLVSINYIVTLETNGSTYLSTSNIYRFHSVIMDLKAPSTGMSEHMYFDNLKRLRKRDFIKVVIQDRNDYLWALDHLPKDKYRAQIAFGPRWGYLDPKEIIEWLKADKRFDIMLNVQLHKMLYPETIGTEIER